MQHNLYLLVLVWVLSGLNIRRVIPLIICYGELENSLMEGLKSVIIGTLLNNKTCKCDIRLGYTWQHGQGRTLYFRNRLFLPFCLLESIGRE